MGETKNTRVRVPVWLRIVLGVSLALNLMVLGLLGGAMLRYGGPEGVRPPPRSIGAALFRALPGEDRRALREHSSAMATGAGMPMKGGQNGAHARQMALTKDISDALRATPFDLEVLSDILVEQAAQREGVQKSVQQALLERVAGMSAQDRLAYADRLAHVMGRYRDRERRKKPRKEPANE